METHVTCIWVKGDNQLLQEDVVCEERGCIPSITLLTASTEGLDRTMCVTAFFTGYHNFGYKTSNEAGVRQSNDRGFNVNLETHQCDCRHFGTENNLPPGYAYALAITLNQRACSHVFLLRRLASH